ncbi:MAG: NTP transferase domain-containing protein [Acidimicrobiales bacterium]
MTNASLVVMAAGLGSRFGGVKQLAAVGPGGEVILDYTIRDAMAAGVDEVILIVRRDILSDTEDHVRSVHGDGLPLTFVCQDDLGPPRDKPWGTVHAVLSAAGVVTSPFILANADDYYGTRSFQIAFDRLGNLSADRGLLVAFEVGKTLPAHGSVTRGVCSVEAGLLVGIDETSGLHQRADGTIGIEGSESALDPRTPVSMNLWGFDPSIMGALEGRWGDFHSAHGSEPKSECLLPTEVSALMNEGYEVELQSSPETWTGITNPDDLETVRGQIALLRDATEKG